MFSAAKMMLFSVTQWTFPNQIQNVPQKSPDSVYCKFGNFREILFSQYC